MTQYRIVEERDASGEVWNYEIQARVFFMWLPVGNSRTLDYAREAVMRLTTTKKTVVPAEAMSSKVDTHGR